MTVSAILSPVLALRIAKANTVKPTHQKHWLLAMSSENRSTASTWLLRTRGRAREKFWGRTHEGKEEKEAFLSPSRVALARLNRVTFLCLSRTILNLALSLIKANLCFTWKRKARPLSSYLHLSGLNLSFTEFSFISRHFSLKLLIVTLKNINQMWWTIKKHDKV